MPASAFLAAKRASQFVGIQGFLPMPTSFGDWLKEKREAAGFTQEEFGKMLDLTKTQISRIEDGQQGTKPVNIPRMATALNADPYEALALLAEMDINTPKMKATSPLAVYVLVTVTKHGKEIPGYQYPGVEVNGKMMWMVSEEPQTEEEVDNMRIALEVVLARKRNSPG